MKYRITGQMSSGISGEHPHTAINFVDIDRVVEANNEYEALEKVPATGTELYLCRDLVIQPIASPHLAV